jgi:trk system potassium uptake protein TrkH
MNKKIIFYTIKTILSLEILFLVMPLLISFYYQENWRLKFSYIITMFLIFLFIKILPKEKPKGEKVFTKEGFAIVSLSWIFMSLFGALPFYISGEVPSYIDSIFEVVSGFTTTGATVIPDIEVISKSLLFWRSFTLFIGGMGMLVLVIAIIPQTDNASNYILKAEVPGPTFGKLVSKMSYNSRILYLIYLALTIILIVFLKLAGMPLFDAIIHSFGVAATGGFSVKNSSVAYYNNGTVEYILAVGMLIFGINFNIFYFIIIGKFKEFLKNEELKWYISIIFISFLLICLNLFPNYKSFELLVRDVFFTVSSLITSTAYATVNFGAWPLFSQIILLFLIFVGGCAGSTAGGLKISRVIILGKIFLRTIKKMSSPNRKLTVQMNGKKLTNELEGSVTNYLLVYIIFFVILLIILSLEIPDFFSCFSAAAAIINNAGTGFGIVGPEYNYSSFSDATKIIITFYMLLGRLEIFPLLIIFSASLYRNKR